MQRKVGWLLIFNIPRFTNIWEFYLRSYFVSISFKRNLHISSRVACSPILFSRISFTNIKLANIIHIILINTLREYYSHERLQIRFADTSQGHMQMLSVPWIDCTQISFTSPIFFSKFLFHPFARRSFANALRIFHRRYSYYLRSSDLYNVGFFHFAPTSIADK